tara:strand:+ start:75 stop:347 length:273 start_codon:yes stop_codon:yes gene_type:complete
MHKNFIIALFALFAFMTNVSAADLYSISYADDIEVTLDESNSRVVDGKRVKIDNKLSMQEQIFKMMPRDKQRDNIYEGLSTDLYNLSIRF